MRKKWIIQRTNSDFVSHLSNAAGVSPALAQVLINRGMKTAAQVSGFLGPGDLSDPFELKGIGEAVRQIKKMAKKGAGEKGKILVHGDYDVDGVSSTAILVDALRGALGLEVEYFIPDRFRHGYGFHKDAVQKALDCGAGMIITTDCGITAFEAAEEAASKGIVLVITDHHEPERGPGGAPRLPRAAAVVNPRLDDGGGTCGLSGAGVALKLAQAILGEEALSYLDLAALGTLADVVPLSGENRAIVKAGIARMSGGGRGAIEALKEVAGLNRTAGASRKRKTLNARSLCYTLIPRINAPGRLEGAGAVVDFLLSKKKEEAMPFAASLDRLNRERQLLEEKVYLEAAAIVARDGFDGAIVLAAEGWHEGVLGIVASRLAEEFYRPAVVLSIKGDTARGSGRSIPEFDLYGGLHSLRGLLTGFGGHRQAAGLRLKTGALDRFREGLSDAVKKEVTDFRATLKIDADLALKEVNMRLIEEIDALEPFGCGNPEPLFGARGIKVVAARVVGNGHLKMKLRHGKTTLQAIGFGMAGEMRNIEENDSVDAAFTPVLDEWEGGGALQLNLKGLRPSC